MNHLPLLDTIVGSFGYLLTLTLLLGGIAYLRWEQLEAQFTLGGLTLREQGERVDAVVARLEAHRKEVLALREAARAAMLDAKARRREYVPEWEREAYDEPAVAFVRELSCRELRTFDGIGKRRAERIRKASAGGYLDWHLLRHIVTRPVFESLLNNLAVGLRLERVS